MATQPKPAGKPTDLISKKHKESGEVQELPRQTWDLMGPELSKYEAAEAVEKPKDLN